MALYVVYCQYKEIPVPSKEILDIFAKFISMLDYWNRCE